MNRRQFIRHTGITIAGLALIQNAAKAGTLGGQDWKITMLTKNVGIFTEKGGTIAFLITSEGIVVIDSQFPETALHLSDGIKTHTEQPFQLLINTHHHADHSSGNIFFKGLVRDVVAHENSKTNQQTAAIKNQTESKQYYPSITFTDTWKETIGGEQIEMHYFGAAHTNGDSLVHLVNSNIVHLGDLVFNRRFPYIDKSAGAHIGSWISVLNKADQFFSNKTQFICGHAADGYDVILKKSDLSAFRNYLEQLVFEVGTALKAGKTKEEILKITEIPGAPEWKGKGIERSLQAAIDEMAIK